MLIYSCKLCFFASSRLVLPALATLSSDLGILPLALLSRRQYLSRMDRFQHGRSARTLGGEGAEINKKCRVFALV